MEFALLAILVGIMVGKAMVRGSGGRGSRRLQIAAVLLTYGSITTGYIPTIIKGFQELDQKKGFSAAAQQKQAAPGRKVGAGGVALGIALLLVIGLAAPLLSLTEGFSGILGIVIIFFGLRQAWRLTAADPAVLSGPSTAAGA